MERSFDIPARFHPAHSPLGRWIRRRDPDRRAAESTYIVAAVTLAIGLMLSQFLAWAYLRPLTSETVSAFFAVQLAIAVAYVALAVFGRQPAVHVRTEDDGLHVERRGGGSFGPRLDRGSDVLYLPFAEITSVSIVSAQTYHRHYARYAATRTYVNRLHPSVLVIETSGRPLVLGLEPSDALELERMLVDRTEALPAPRRVGAA